MSQTVSTAHYLHSFHPPRASRLFVEIWPPSQATGATISNAETCLPPSTVTSHHGNNLPFPTTRTPTITSHRHILKSGVHKMGIRVKGVLCPASIGVCGEIPTLILLFFCPLRFSSLSRSKHQVMWCCVLVCWLRRWSCMGNNSGICQESNLWLAYLPRQVVYFAVLV